MTGHRSYRVARYEFGKQLLTLRTRISLTQLELAQQIGVHRRSVQNWETGDSYPKAETLQRLIALFLTRHAFTEGEERAEAVALWQQVDEDGAQGFALFDEHWFSKILAGRAPEDGVESPSIALPITPTISSPIAPSSANVGEMGRAMIDWGEAIAAPSLYGREDEIELLRQWAVEEHCRLIAILGLGGIGKSSLAVTFAKSAVSDFDFVLFRSLQNGPLIGDLLDQIIRAVSEQQQIAPEALPDKLAMLVQLFREQRCLLILDNLETILQPGALAGAYRAEYVEYGQLLRALGERNHQSCLLLTSREKPTEVALMEGRTSPVRVLTLSGLSDQACQSILEAKDIVGAATDLRELVRLFGGNPLALNLVSEPIRELFGGDVASFLTTGDAFFEGVGRLLEQQFTRSTPLEQSLLYWLAVERELVSLNDLIANAGEGVTQRELLAALESLRHRMQIERGPNRPYFTLQPVILEYMSEQLLDVIGQEIVTGKPKVLQSHALMQAHAKEYVRRSQERLLLAPLLKRVLVLCGGAGPLARQLLALLDGWRQRPFAEQGYGPGNVIHLLRLLRGDLRGLNLTRLLIRDVYWQGVEAQDSDLTNAVIRDNSFTKAFGIVHAVASSASGRYWAASTINGAVHVWRDEGRTTHLAIQAQNKQVKALVFSPNEEILATGSWDCTIKLWNLESGALLRTLEGHSDYVQSIAFSPDGRFLASSGDDQMVRIWHVASGACLRVIHAHSDNAYGVVWSHDGERIISGGFDAALRMWDVSSGLCLQSFTGHTHPITSLAISPDSSLLASGGFDCTVRIWDVASAECIKVFAEHSSTVMAMTWSADGRTIASCGYDGSIRLLDVHPGVQPTIGQRVLHGHLASVTSVAFSGGGATLLSGSDDGTVRVWDVAQGWTVRVIEGYSLFFFGVVWSPDGRYLLSANSDTTLTLWNVGDGSVRLTLLGHTRAVYGVAWSPDGRWLASGGYDQTIRIWDATTGVCVRILQGHSDIVYRMVWNADGRWLASTGRDQSVRIWEIATGLARWVARGHTSPINEVVWSPDSKRLASCGEDRTIRLWRAEDGALLQTLSSHETSVAGVAWSPDGRLLASSGGGGSFGELFVWDVESGERLRALVGHTSVVFRVAWGRDSKILFSGGITGMIRWWDVESGNNLYTRQSHKGWVRSLAVSPDGSMLVSSGEDGVVHLWDVTSAELVRTLRIDRPYERMDISGLGGITSAQRASLLALGAEEREK